MDETPRLSDLRAALANLTARGDDDAAAAIRDVIAGAEYAEYRRGAAVSASGLRSIAETIARRLDAEAVQHDADGDTERAAAARRGVAALEGYRPFRRLGGA